MALSRAATAASPAIRKMPEAVIDKTVEMLVAQGLLVEVPQDGAAFFYLPSRAIETISVEEVIRAARSFGEQPIPDLFQILSSAGFEAVEETMKKIAGSLSESVQGRSIKDVVLASPLSEPDGPSPNPPKGKGSQPLLKPSP